MRSRPDDSSSGFSCGVTSDPTPLRTSLPARLMCPAAGARRSPGTSRYAASPSRGYRFFGSGGVIAQPHRGPALLDAGPRGVKPRYRVGEQDVPLLAPYPHEQLGPALREVHALLLGQGQVEYHIVPAAVLHYLVRGSSEEHTQRVHPVEDVIGQRMECFEAVHLAVEESGLEDRDRGEGALYRLQVLLLSLMPPGEVRVRDLGRQQPVDHDRIHPVIIEVQVGIGASRLGDHHLLRVRDDPDGGALPIREYLLDPDDRLVEPLAGGEHVVFRERGQRPSPPRERTNDLRRPALDGENLLHVPADLIRQAQQLQGLSGRGGVHYECVVEPLAVGAPDHEETEELIRPRQHRQLFGSYRVRPLPLEEGRHVVSYLGPVLL